MSAHFLHVSARVPTDWALDAQNEFENILAHIDYDRALCYVHDSEPELLYELASKLFADAHPDLGDAAFDVYDALSEMEMSRYLQRVVRDMVRDALANLVNDRSYAEVECRGYTELVTGGLSYGDSPTDSFDAIMLLAHCNLVPEAAQAKVDAQSEVTYRLTKDEAVLLARLLEEPIQAALSAGRGVTRSLAMKIYGGDHSMNELTEGDS